MTSPAPPTGPPRDPRPFPPVFATNRPDRGETVAGEVVRLLSGMREDLAAPPALAIATAYLNPGGVGLILDELAQAPRVRLLLGAEPEAAAVQAPRAELRENELQEALRRHQAWLAAERDLTGFTREADATAHRLVEWLQSKDGSGERRVEVRRYTKGFLHGKAFLVDHERQRAVLAGSSNLTYAGLARNAELNLGYPSTEHTHLVQEWFDHFWQRANPFPLDQIYASRWNPHRPWTVFLRMLWELYGRDIHHEDEEPTRGELKLTGFQRDGVSRMLRLLESNGGVIVADEVGLGKTFMAGAVIGRASAENRQHVLVLAPAALRASMWEPFLRKYDFSRRVDVWSYDDLRLRWQNDQTEARRALDEYALVVVDEAHNLRNPQAQRTEAVAALVGGEHPKRVVLLTATPVNNSLTDLHALVSLFVRNDAAFAAAGIPSIRDYIAHAQALDPESLSPEHLFDLLDRVAVRRTRRFVKEHYTNDRVPDENGVEQTIRFPTPRLHRMDYELDAAGTALLEAVTYALDSPDGDAARHSERRRDPKRLMLARYTSSAYSRYETLDYKYQASNAGLLRSALLKRLESSPAALRQTLATLIDSHRSFASALREGWVLVGTALRDWIASDAEDLGEYLDELDHRETGGAEPADRFHRDILAADVDGDFRLLHRLHALAEDAAHSDADPKAERLLDRLREIASEARGASREGLSQEERRKVIVFSSFVDTVKDLQQRARKAINDAPEGDALSDYRNRLPKEAVYGSKAGADQNARARLLARFAPRTAGHGQSDDRYDLLFTTDVLSEGVNLQQAGRIINYDLPWNPMRVVQRHGRIDRIGSPHSRVHLDCFFPSRRLDELLGLEERLRHKLALADAAVGSGQVLPGVSAGTGQVFTDTRRQIMDLYAEDASLLDDRGHHAALSGEEYRRRLRDAMKHGDEGASITGLPYASGSGFVHSRLPQSGYVFCIRVGNCVGNCLGTDAETRLNRACESCRRPPRFRFVAVDDRWLPLEDEHGEPILRRDTLQALIAADPGRPETGRRLSDQAYDGAFEAWRIARNDVWREWMRLTDPANLQPEVPKAFRDATELLHSHGAEVLSADGQARLVACFNTVPTPRTQRVVRQILNSDAAAADQVRRLQEVAKELGLRPPVPPEPLPPAALEEVRLVAWVAVLASAPALR